MVLNNNMISHGKVSVLLYHQLGVEINKHTNLDCFCLRDNFYQQMKFLKENNYNVVTLSDACDYIFKGNATGDSPRVVLTFDDADTSFIDFALPILQEFSFPSVLFVVTGFLGLKSNWQRNINNQLNIISKDDLRYISSLGVEIGSHTVSHLRLTNLNDDDISRELFLSKVFLEDFLGKEVPLFSYPHGLYNANIVNFVKSLGYTYAVTCNPNYAHHAFSVYEIPRKYITAKDNVESFSRIINL